MSIAKEVGLDLASKRKRKRSDYGYHLDYRLRWNDNDVFGHMNNPYYGVIIDSIANQYLIDHCDYKMNRSAQAGIIANTYCDYFGSVEYPGVIEAGLRIAKLGKSSVMYEVGIFKKGEEGVRAVGGSTHVFVDQVDGKLGKASKDGMPKEVRQGFESLMRRCEPKLITQRLCATGARTHRPSVRTFHKDYNAEREEQKCQLRDGRILGFAEYGNLQGTPVFLLHGSSGSRYDGSGFIDVARKLNIHIISPDRPGHGLSSFQPNRVLEDHALDISQLAKHLGIPKYHVVGGSGGGPYTVACAYKSPSDELLSANVIAGAAPPDVNTIKTAGWYTTLTKSAIQWMPNLTLYMMNRVVSDDKKLRKQLELLPRLLKEEDRVKLSSPEAKEVIFNCVKEAYAQGAKGVFRDSQLMFTPWNFELKDVQRKVKLFYGHKDDRTPPAFGRYYHKHLPNSELYEFEDASHFTIEKYDEDIFRNVLGLPQTQDAMKQVEKP